MWDDFPFRDYTLSIDRIDYQFNIGSNKSNSGDKWNMFKNRGMHFIHLNVNSLLPKREEMRHLVKLANASVIAISETKLDGSKLDVLS